MRAFDSTAAGRGIGAEVRGLLDGVSAGPLMRATLTRFVPFAALVIVGMLLVQQRHRQDALAHLRDEGQRVVEAQVDLMRNAFVGIGLEVGRLVGDGGPRRLAEADAEIGREAATQGLVNLLRWRDVFDRAQVLDAAGREVVRVERAAREAPPRVALPGELGDQSASEAFLGASQLEAGGLFVGRVGLEATVTAAATVSPVVHFAAPLRDGAGRLQAVVVLRWRADRLLDLMRRAVPERRARLAIVDDGGGWLVGEERADGWRFRRPGEAEARFDRAFPELWASMQHVHGDSAVAEDGLWLHGSLGYPRRGQASRDNFGERRATFGLDGEQQLWRIAYFVPTAVIRAHTGPLLPMPFRGGLLVTLLLFCGVLAWADERRRAALARLAESERRTAEQLAFSEALVDGLGVPLFVKDLEGRIVRCNEAFLRLTGRARATCVGASAAVFDPAQHAERHAAMDAMVRSTRQPVTYDSDVFDETGATRAVVVTKAPLLGVGGGLEGIVGALQDVSERQRAEHRLRRAFEFQTLLLDSLPTPVFVKDRDRRFVLVNDALCRMTGLRQDQLLGKRDDDFFPPQDVAVYRERDEHVFATREVDLNEEKLIDAGGLERTIVTRKAVFPDPQGEDVLVGVISDITDRKRAEEELRMAALFFEHSTEGIVVCDANERIVRVNQAFTEITGYASDEVVGQHPSFLDAVPAQDLQAEMQRALHGAGHWHGEIVHRRRNGVSFPSWLSISAVHDDTDRITCYVSMFSDITERKAHEERVRWLAQHDLVTGLPNRRLLVDRVEHALRRAERDRSGLALLAIDLDRFKSVNDRFGHAAGDRLLRLVAERLQGAVRETDTVARIGGDEFAVVLPDVGCADDIRRVAQSIVAEIGRPFELEGREVSVGVSVGASRWPSDGGSLEELLRVADAEMYAVKNSGRNAYRISGLADEAPRVAGLRSLEACAS